MNKKTQKTMFSSDKNEWGTPLDFVRPYIERCRLTVDAAANDDNAKCPTYFTKEEDGLKQNWTGLRIWVNPPYSRTATGQWVEKAATGGADIVVMLLPARTDTKWFHKWIWDRNIDAPRPHVVLEFIQGRIKFDGAKNGAPFPSMVVIFHNKKQ